MTARPKTIAAPSIAELDPVTVARVRLMSAKRRLDTANSHVRSANKRAAKCLADVFDAREILALAERGKGKK